MIKLNVTCPHDNLTSTYKSKTEVYGSHPLNINKSISSVWRSLKCNWNKLCRWILVGTKLGHILSDGCHLLLSVDKILCCVEQEVIYGLIEIKTNENIKQLRVISLILLEYVTQVFCIIDSNTFVLWNYSTIQLAGHVP